MSVQQVRQQQDWTTRTGLPVLTEPIFVGGVPRSGTTVVGKRMLGRHHKIGCTIPAEMWFLTNTGGLVDMAAGEEDQRVRLRTRINAMRRGHLSSMGAFEDRMLGFWYKRPWWRDGRDKGLCQSVSRKDLVAALEAFHDRYPDDPVQASRLLAADIIDPSIRERGKSRWVDTTPANAPRIDALYRVFPDLLLVHMVRDGRDVAASIVSRGWGTDDFTRALQEWHDGMLANYRAILRIPLGRAHTVQLENLIGPDGLDYYERLLEFLGIYDSPKMRAYFVENMNPEEAHVGRWRSEVLHSDLLEIDRTYAKMLESLDAAGVPVPAMV